MAKFILHGGSTSQSNPLNQQFFHEITKDLKNNAQVLIMYFSRQDEECEKLFEQDKKNFLDNANGKNLKLVIAGKNNFIEQIKQSDALYMRGGGTMKLFDILKEQKQEFKQAIQSKTIAGSSAGVYVLSRYFYTSSNEILEGLGVLPIAVRCHYNGERHIVDELKKYADKDSLKIVLLKDCEYIILEQ